jgi:hypothetical protein
MKLPVGKGGSSFGRRPHIRKNYYPGQLLNVKKYTDSDGNEVEKQFGKMLIFEFGVYDGDSDGTPTKPMTYKDSESGEESSVILPKFTYYMYKSKDNEGEFYPAVKINPKTGQPTSAIAKLLVNIGWDTSKGEPDPEEYIGSWVDLNVNDYEASDGDDKYTASTIQGVDKYSGKEIPKDLELITMPKRKEGEDSSSSASKETTEKPETPKTPSKETIEELQNEQIAKLKELKDQGLLSEEAYNNSVEQIKSKL